MEDQSKKQKVAASPLWPNVSDPEVALESANLTQFIAYWIGGSYIVIGYLGSASTNIIIGIIIAILGLAIWKKNLWAVPIVAGIGILESGLKIVLALSFVKLHGIAIAAFVLFYSFHGLRAWMSLRRQSHNANTNDPV